MNWHIELTTKIESKSVHDLTHLTKRDDSSLKTIQKCYRVSGFSLNLFFLSWSSIQFFVKKSERLSICKMENKLMFFNKTHHSTQQHGESNIYAVEQLVWGRPTRFLTWNQMITIWNYNKQRENFILKRIFITVLEVSDGQLHAMLEKFHSSFLGRCNIVPQIQGNSLQGSWKKVRDVRNTYATEI